MDRVALDLGIIQIYWYSIFIFLSLLLGGWLFAQETKKNNLPEEHLVNLFFYAVIIGILGARLYYVLFNINYYLANPLEIIAVWNGGLAIHGGIIAAALFIIYYCKKYNLNFLKLLDIIVVSLIIGQAIGRWGNFFNSEAYGPATNLTTLKNLKIPTFIINGMFILGKYHHPTFYYESLACFVGFCVLLILRKFYKNLKVGQLTSIYLIWYGIVRFFIESLRTDSLMLGPIKIAQIISLIFILAGIFLLIFTLKQKNNLYSKQKLIRKKESSKL